MLKNDNEHAACFFDYCYRYLFQVALFHFILSFLLHRTMWGLASATKRCEA